MARRLLVRIARRVHRGESVQTPGGGGEALASFSPLEVVQRSLQSRVADAPQLLRAGRVVEHRLVEQEARADLGQLRQVAEVDLVGGVVLGVVLGAVELRGERRDVDPGDSGREERPDLGPRVGPAEAVAVREQPVAPRGAAVAAHPGRELRRRVEREHVRAAGALEVEVEGRAGRPLAVLRDDLVPGAIAPVVGRFSDAVLLGGVRDEGERPARPDAGLGEGPRELERDRDSRRIVEGGPEPAVVVAGDDRRRAPLPAGELTDDVDAQGPGRERRAQHDPDAASELRRILAADRQAGRALRMPDPVEGAERSGRLVVRAALWRVDDHGGRPAQAELKPHVVGPQAGDLPFHQRDPAGDVQAVELPAAPAADRDELALDALRARRGNPTEGGALEPRAVLELDVGLLEPPPVDGHRLLDDLLEPDRAHLARDERGRLALLRRARHAEAERMRADRLEPSNHVLEVLGREPHVRPSSSPSRASRTSGPSDSRS